MTKLLSEKRARARAIHNIKLYWDDEFKADILDMRKFYWSLQDINELGEFESAAILGLNHWMDDFLNGNDTSWMDIELTQSEIDNIDYSKLFLTVMSKDFKGY